MHQQIVVKIPNMKFQKISFYSSQPVQCKWTYIKLRGPRVIFHHSCANTPKKKQKFQKWLWISLA